MDSAMKKILLLLSTFLLAIGMCACVSVESEPAGGEDVQEGPAEYMDWTTFDNEGYDAVAYVVMGDAEVLVYMDGNANIQKVAGYTDAGTTVCDAINVTGQSYPDGLTAIWDEMLTQGYISAEPYFYLEVACTQSMWDSYDWTDVSVNAKTNFEFNNDVSASGHDFGAVPEF